MKIATAQQMRTLDRKAIEEFSIPGMILMENAGRGTVLFMEEELGPVKGKGVPIFCGPGNNGGDGLVIARTVHQLGGHPLIFFLVQPEKLKGDAAQNFHIIQQSGFNWFCVANEADLQHVEDCIHDLRNRYPLWSLVDALFGTGLKRNATGLFFDTIALINSTRDKFQVPVTAVDTPSGLDSDTGKVLGACVDADLTATYGVAKPAHFMHGGSFIGSLKVIDIGIPPEVVKSESLQGNTIDTDIATLIQNRARSSHKGSYGHLLIIAGSEGKTGASILSALGALKSGCGLVSLAVPRNLNAIYETALPEAMTIPLQKSFTYPVIDDFDFLLKQARGKTAIVLGPGLGTLPETAELVTKLYKELTIPLVIDADGLNILAANRQILDNPAAARIFTPHPGEMARLLDISSKEVQVDRLHAAGWLSKNQTNNSLSKVELITVLKGAGTICYHNNGAWAINTSGNPGMASGGMGDVLSGVLGSFLSQGYSPWEASQLGVYIHGLAADILAADKPIGYLASEVAATLPTALKKCSLTKN